MIFLFTWIVLTFFYGLIWGLLQHSIYSGISLFLLLLLSPVLIIVMIITKPFISFIWMLKWKKK